MKKLTGIILLLLAAAALNAQDYTHAVHVANDGRNYYINKTIPGATEDGTAPNYILLHRAYAGAVMNDEHVMGKITAIRGNGAAWNRKWTIEVNTASAHVLTRGTMISYNEGGGRLVTLTYGGESYLAAEIPLGSTVHNISFTGYANNPALILALISQVSNVQLFSSQYDQITLQGQTVISDGGAYSTLQVISPAANVNMGSEKVFAGGIAIRADQTGRDQTKGATLEFVLPAELDGTNYWGQGRIMTVPGNATNGHATGKMILGTRRHFNKVNAGNQWYYGDDIVIDGSGNVGIGTLNPQAKLAVKGEINAQKVKVTLTGWSDFVFEPGYKLPSIYEMEQYIQQHKHLPGIPSETEVKEKGIDVGEMNKLLLQKVEEQMLYIIELKKQMDEMRKEMDVYKKK